MKIILLLLCTALSGSSLLRAEEVLFIGHRLVNHNMPRMFSEPAGKEMTAQALQKTDRDALKAFQKI